MGVVESIESERTGAQELSVRTESGMRQAINYAQLTGSVAIGDTVFLNTWATALGLGTGGLDFVIAVDRPDQTENASGHLMKLRYTPLQIPVLAAESPESEFHDVLNDFSSLDGTPVVCAELHSQVAAAAAAAKWKSPRAKVVYVMSDGASLPMAFSRLVPQLRERKLLDGVVTTGQSFGGDFEAVNIYTGLVVARLVAGADIIIVGQGPGNAGTATPLGFSGIDQGIALNAVVTLGGAPIAVPRISFADPRPRHQGLSHHTTTILEQVALGRVTVPIPTHSDEQAGVIAEQMPALIAERHDIVIVDAQDAFAALVAGGLEITTMGRRIEEDPAFFKAACAAGVLAGQIYENKAD
jgi:hypothetical protein